MPMMTELRLLAALLAAMSLACARGSECQLGAYRRTDGAQLFLLPAEDRGFRYSLMDGRMGLLERASCNSGEARFPLEGEPDTAWSKVQLDFVDTTFAGGEGVKLAGRLITPPGAERFPLMVLVHGSERTAAIGKNVWQFLLAANGIAVFVYDKRGTGASSGAYTQNFELLATDAALAAEEARRLASGKIERLGFLGGSQGGWVAPLAATKTKVDYLQIMFGLVGSPLEEDAWQVEYQLTRRGYAAEPWFPIVEGEYSGPILASGSAAAPRIAEDSPGISWNYGAPAVLRQLNIPQTWILAAEDAEAPSAPTLQRLQGLQAEGKPIEVAIFPDTDHGIVEFIESPGDRSRKRTRRAAGFYALQVDAILGKTGSSSYGRAVFYRPGDAWQRTLLGDREKKDAEFRGPTSPLGAVERRVVQRGEKMYLEAGARFSDRPSKAALYSLSSAGGGEWLWEKLRPDTAPPLGSDEKPLTPGTQKTSAQFRLGRFNISALPSGDTLVLFTFDAQAERLRSFTALSYYPAKLAFAPQARLEKFADPQPITLPTTLGLKKNYLRYGKLHFELNGQLQELTAYKPAGTEKELFIPFRDATSGKSTYGAGRYLDLEEPQGDTLQLDFNRAYNPMCNYSPTYNCPIPPAENRLSTSIEAGEQTYSH
jgi:uncharacterized protein